MHHNGRSSRQSRIIALADYSLARIPLPPDGRDADVGGVLHSLLVRHASAVEHSLGAGEVVAPRDHMRPAVQPDGPGRPARSRLRRRQASELDVLRVRLGVDDAGALAAGGCVCHGLVPSRLVDQGISLLTFVVQ